MKYFTKVLWQSFQAKDPRRADKEWKKRYHAYCAQLEKIKARLSPSARRFFRKPLLLHDGTLISCSVGDFQHRPLSDFLRSSYRTHKLTVSLAVAEDRPRTKLHILTYGGIRKMKLAFPSDEPLFSSPLENLFWDWGYDELSSAGKTHLRHEIVFASGATILIEFRSLRHRAEPIRNR